MGRIWDVCSLAALSVCLGCGSADGNGKANGETSDAATTSSSSTATGAGGTSAGSAGTDADSTATADSTVTAANTGGSSSSTGDTNASTTNTSGAGTGGEPSWPHTETHACLDYVLGFCEQTARCDEGISVISCYAATSARCPDLLFAPGSTRTIDGTFACADEWRALSCDVATPECATAGTLADGEACVTGIQCASRLCSGNADLCGSCLPSARLDEPCDDAAGPQCVPGLVCDTTDLVCVAAPVSSDPPAIGEECSPSSSECYPNDCRADDAGIYRCQPYPALGQDCSEPLTCAFGDSYCDITQVCLALPAAGDPCGVDGFTGMAGWCADGLVCDQTSEPARCVARPGPGEPCDGACEEGLSCNCSDDVCTSQVCQRPRFHGQSCTVPQDGCLMGECVEGTCVVPEAESTFADLCAQ